LICPYVKQDKNISANCVFPVVFFVGMIGLSSSANAQFIGINVDYGIDYSAAPGSVDGYSVGISHPAPFIPNLGYSSVSFKDKDTVTDSSSSNKLSLETTTTIKTINLFYNVPFPVVTITVVWLWCR
jgi:hypothetical protein